MRKITFLLLIFVFIFPFVLVSCADGGSFDASDVSPVESIDTFERVDADGNSAELGEYILFGEYPQTIKDKSVKVSSDADSRGYYLGSDGYYYAKVTATPCDVEYTLSSGDSMKYGEEYYFKVEPIRWRILTVDGGYALILCDSIIDSHRFDDNTNNYAESEIRQWLNNEFYNKAFTQLQGELIKTAIVDNSAESTGNGKNPHFSSDTEDKVFLLSQVEVTNADYGFAENGTLDENRSLSVRDYAIATGAWMNTLEEFYGDGWWWLRSPDRQSATIARGVIIGGNTLGRNSVHFDDKGVVPALWIKL